LNEWAAAALCRPKCGSSDRTACSAKLCRLCLRLGGSADEAGYAGGVEKRCKWRGRLRRWPGLSSRQSTQSMILEALKVAWTVVTGMLIWVKAGWRIGCEFDELKSRNTAAPVRVQLSQNDNGRTKCCSPAEVGAGIRIIVTQNCV
jgi:hypothetical protein